MERRPRRRGRQPPPNEGASSPRDIRLSVVSGGRGRFRLPPAALREPPAAFRLAPTALREPLVGCHHHRPQPDDPGSDGPSRPLASAGLQAPEPGDRSPALWEPVPRERGRHSGLQEPGLPDGEPEEHTAHQCDSDAHSLSGSALGRHLELFRGQPIRTAGIGPRPPLRVHLRVWRRVKMPECHAGPSYEQDPDPEQGDPSDVHRYPQRERLGVLSAPAAAVCPDGAYPLSLRDAPCLETLPFILYQATVTETSQLGAYATVLWRRACPPPLRTRPPTTGTQNGPPQLSFRGAILRWLSPIWWSWGDWNPRPLECDESRRETPKDLAFMRVSGPSGRPVPGNSCRHSTAHAAKTHAVIGEDGACQPAERAVRARGRKEFLPAVWNVHPDGGVDTPSSPFSPRLPPGLSLLC